MKFYIKLDICPECGSSDTYIQLHKQKDVNVFPRRCKSCGNEWTIEKRETKPLNTDKCIGYNAGVTGKQK